MGQIKIKASRKLNRCVKLCKQIAEHSLWEFKEGQIRTDVMKTLEFNGQYFSSCNSTGQRFWQRVYKVAIAYDGDVPIGCSIISGHLPLAGYVCHLRYLGVYVKPEYRGQGIGRRLASRMTCGTASVQVSDASNGAASAFYGKVLGGKAHVWKVASLEQVENIKN